MKIHKPLKVCNKLLAARVPWQSGAHNCIIKHLSWVNNLNYAPNLRCLYLARSRSCSIRVCLVMYIRIDLPKKPTENSIYRKRLHRSTQTTRAHSHFVHSSHRDTQPKKQGWLCRRLSDGCCMSFTTAPLSLWYYNSSPNQKSSYARLVHVNVSQIGNVRAYSRVCTYTSYSV